MLFDRTVATRTTRMASKTKVFPAPVKGWIRNEAFAKPGGMGAEVLDNWFPTPEGIRMRKGSIKRATCNTAAAITHLATYETGSSDKIFATDASNIYDVTSPADPDAAITADVSGLAGGDWSSVQFQAGGGIYLVMANGADSVRNYDGSTWSTPSITGVTSSTLSFVWSFKNRLFFIETGSLSAWYLPVLSISGAASEIDLGGVFKYGGTLMFGATYSRDSGSGLDDFCIFVTENGEIAVYQGSDPSSASDWSLVGVYKIGKPLGKNAFFKAGGDIAIATDDGIVSVTQALSQDRAGQTPITYPIEEAWRIIIGERAFSGFPFQTALWHKQSMLVVAVPAFAGLSKYCLVANAKTGAWARYTGWDMRCIAVFQDKLYFGTQDGLVVEAETGGADQDTSYAAVVIPRFDMLGSPNEKVAMHARVVARTNYDFSAQLFASADYVYDIPAPLPADPDEDGDVWGSGIWGTSVWGGLTETKNAISEWQAVAALGHALAPGLQVASGRDTEPDFELISLHLQYQEGQVMA